VVEVEPQARSARRAGEARTLSAGAKKRALAWLRSGLALLLLAFGAYLVPWKDRLVCIHGRKTVEVAGTIHGAWQSDEVRFAPEPHTGVDPAWPPEIAAALTSGKEFDVRRSPESVAIESGRIDWKPGMLRVFGEVKPWGLWAAFFLILTGAFVAITRWWRLLAVAGCGTRWPVAFRLSFLGLFFNVVLPAGITGGDVIKAVLVVREHPERRADAFVTVVVDRAIGLLVLMALAAIVVLVSGERFAEMKLPVVGAFLAALVGIWVLLHPGTRRALGISRILERMPQQGRLRSIERALRFYSEKPREIGLAILLSCVNHLFIAGSVFVLGHAFGDHLSYLEYLGVAAIANTISSVPITPAGWGVGEWAFGSLFHVLGAPSTLGVAVSVAYRLLNMVLGLAGGLFLLLPGGRTIREEIQEEKKEEEAA
jgi:uncharacterized protein (TIRG00374 family)